jgi:hypothetical protein
MNGWRTDTLSGSTASGSRHAASRRVMGHYLTDLAVSIGIVLLVGWIFQASSGESAVQQASITQNELYIALGHFTPLSVIADYTATMEDMRRTLNAGYSAGGLSVAVAETFATIGWLLLNICLAAPRTLFELYRQTSGIAAWIVLAGFTAAISAVFGWLLAGRFTLWRVVLASAASPLVVSVVFMVLQGVMLMLMSSFYWLTVLAPYAVACPVLCTLYWVVFRHAEHGATSSVAHAIGNLVHGKG